MTEHHKPNDEPMTAAGAPRFAPEYLGAATLLTMLPVTMIVPALKESVALRFGASTFWTHAFMSVNMIGAILATPWIGRLTDRPSSRRTVVIFALLADALLLGLMSRAGGVAELLTLRAFEGVAHMLALAGLMAAAADVAARGRRGRTMGVIGACMMFGTALGTRLGGVAWRVWPNGVFEAAGATAVLAALFVYAIAPGFHGAERPQAARSRRRLHLGLDRRILIPCVYTFIDRFCVGVVISSFVLFLADCHALGPDERSRLLAMFLVPFALLVYPAGRLVDRLGVAWPLAGGSAAFGLLFAAYGFLPREWLPVAMFGSGVLSAAMFAPTLTLIAAWSDSERRGAACARFNAAGAFGFVCGPLAAGAICHSLVDAWGARAAYQAAFVVAGLAEFVCAAATLPWLLHCTRRDASVRGDQSRTQSIESADVAAAMGG